MWCVVEISNDASLSSPQNNWTKNLFPLAKFVTMVREKAIQTIEAIEAKTTGDLPITFAKCLEPLVVPKDLHALADVIVSGEQRPSVSLLHNEAKRIVRARWWQWTLLHPGLQPDRVHPSRGLSKSRKVPQSPLIPLQQPSPKWDHWNGASTTGTTSRFWWACGSGRLPHN